MLFRSILSNVHNGADVFPIADDQITSMVAGGALYEIEDVDAVKTVSYTHLDVYKRQLLCL